MAEVIFNPDADPENNSVDGWAKHNDNSGITWAALRGGAGTEASSDSDWGSPGIQTHGSDSNKFTNLVRVLLLFDTSPLPDGKDITSAFVKAYIDDKDNWGSETPGLVVCSSTPTTDTNVIAADYTKTGAVALSDTILYDDITVNAFNTFTLNAAGIAAISKTGITKLAIREATYDFANIAPTWSPNATMSFRIQMADKVAGATPILSVNYLIPENAMVRVTGLVIHWSAGPNGVYQQENLTGGLFSQYFSPVSAQKEPEPTIPTAPQIITDPLPTVREYAFWMGTHTQAQQRAIFGTTIITLKVWQHWVLGQRAMGKEIL